MWSHQIADQAGCVSDKWHFMKQEGGSSGKLQEVGPHKRAVKARMANSENGVEQRQKEKAKKNVLRIQHDVMGRKLQDVPIPQIGSG